MARSPPVDCGHCAIGLFRRQAGNGRDAARIADDGKSSRTVMTIADANCCGRSLLTFVQVSDGRRIRLDLSKVTIHYIFVRNLARSLRSSPASGFLLKNQPASQRSET
jgi:hypothetical protein